jgi:exopolysaccharide production protein ExoQ
MPPSLALLIWLFLLLGLLYFDPSKERGNSLALWVPVIWLFFVGSRLPSQWLGGQVGTLAQAYEESNPLNGSVFLGLILVATAILISRSFRWGAFFTRNLFLMAYVMFALMSMFWSDSPVVTFKRWFRDLGGCLVMLVVLSDPHPLEGVRTVLRRFCYLVIPLSILLAKYFPEMGRQYDAWTGAIMFTGAMGDKNSLGAACLVSGIFFIWDTVMRRPDRTERRTRRILLVNLAFMWMTIWLLYNAKSATSQVCLIIGAVVIVAAASKAFERHPAFFKALIPTCFCSYVILAYWFNANAYLVGAVGRNPTLTDRTFIWETLLSMKTNPAIGTGYRSFFLGTRLQQFWLTHPGINEAHNGYLDIYLTLGLIGLILLLGFLITSYQTIWGRFRSCRPLASLGLAIWTIILFYNITEAAFDNSLLWLVLILGAIVVQERAADGVHCVAAVERASAKERFLRFPLKAVSHRR